MWLASQPGRTEFRPSILRCDRYGRGTARGCTRKMCARAKPLPLNRSYYLLYTPIAANAQYIRHVHVIVYINLRLVLRSMYCRSDFIVLCTSVLIDVSAFCTMLHARSSRLCTSTQNHPAMRTETVLLSTKAPPYKRNMKGKWLTSKGTVENPVTWLGRRRVASGVKISRRVSDRDAPVRLTGSRKKFKARGASA